jgi:hypothetical protein
LNSSLKIKLTSFLQNFVRTTAAAVLPAVAFAGVPTGAYGQGNEAPPTLLLSLSGLVIAMAPLTLGQLLWASAALPSVEIKAMERSVLSYLTKPLIKTFSQTLGER